MRMVNAYTYVHTFACECVFVCVHVSVLECAYE
jgi:hypothetical protein